MTTYSGWANVPEGLATKTTLKKEGLRLARGQQPVAEVMTQFGSKRNYYKLYDKSLAIAAKPATPAQLAAIEKAKTASLEKRTCQRCGYVEELSRNYRNKIYVRNGACPNCERQYQIEDDHDDAIEWAKAILADDKAIILDCETVTFNSEIIELAIINIQGEALFNKRFKPVLAIADGATAVHGMTAEMLQNEAVFADCDSQLRSIFDNASKVIIYNKVHDLDCLKVTRDLHNLPSFKIRAKTECAMEMYAQFVGDWSNYHGGYKWYPLGGSHDALGDCMATLATLHEMAQAEAYSKEEVSR